jgi:hypothetical protein
METKGPTNGYLVGLANVWRTGNVKTMRIAKVVNDFFLVEVLC